jgi:DNA-binding response OmpR family regulator
MTDIQQQRVTGAFMAIVGVDAAGLPTTKLFECPELQELVLLRLEVAGLKARISDTAFDEASFDFRREFKLSAQQARLLAMLYVNAPGVVGYAAIYDMLYGHRIDGGPENPHAVVKAFVHAIRAEIGSEAIENEHGRGFRLTGSGLAKCNEARGVSPLGA